MKKITFLCVFSVILFTAFSYSADVKRAAVLTFVNLTKESSIEWIGESFSEALNSKLCNIKGLMLIDRLQMDRILQEQKLSLSRVVDERTAAVAGKILGVEYAVIGSFQKNGEVVSADIRLVKVETGQVVATGEIQGTSDKLFDLQEKLADMLSRSLDVPVTRQVEKLLAAPPAKSPEAYEWYCKGLDFYWKGNNPQAAECFSRAIEQDPGFARAYSMRALTTGLGFGDPKVIADLEKGISLASSDTLVYKIKMWMYFNDTDKVLENAGYIISINPRDADAYADMAEVYKREGKMFDPKYNSKALECYDKAIAIRPNFASIYYNRGMFYTFNLSTDTLALADFKKACELGHEGACMEVRKIQKDSGGGEADFTAYMDKGQQCEKNNLINEAIDEYTKALSVKRDASAYFARGNAYKAGGDCDRAIEDYSQSIAVKPFADTFAQRGVCYFMKGDYSRAKDDLARCCDTGDRTCCKYHLMAKGNLAKQANPALDDDVKDLVDAAKKDYEAKEYERAIEHSIQAMSKDPGEPYCYYWIAISYQDMNNYVKAIEYWDKCLLLDSGNSPANYNRGVCYRAISLDNRNSALNDFNEACKQGNQDACAAAKALQ